MASSRGNAQWTNVDAFQLVAGAACAGYGLSIDSSQSTLLVVGGARTNGSSGAELAVTRQSSDLGQTWQTASAYIYPNTGWAGAASGGDTFYAVGADDAQWLVAESTDGGATWTTSDLFQLASGQSAACLGVAVDGAGNAYSAGYAYTSSTASNFVIRRRDAGGGAWRTVYQAQGGEGNSIAIHPTGGVFVIGSLPYKRLSAWAVLQSTDGGGSWRVADLYPYSSGSSFSEGHGIAVDGVGNIYATGQFGNSWVTRKSADAGLTWSTVDNFKDTMSRGFGVGFDYKNDVYVAGWTFVNNSFHWIVRMLPSGGGSWQVSDDFQLAPAEHAMPGTTGACILSANSGRLLFVTGAAADSSGVDVLVTRRLVVP